MKALWNSPHIKNEGKFKDSYYLLVNDKGTPKKILFSSKKQAHNWLKK